MLVSDIKSDFTVKTLKFKRLSTMVKNVWGVSTPPPCQIGLKGNPV